MGLVLLNLSLSTFPALQPAIILVADLFGLVPSIVALVARNG